VREVLVGKKTNTFRRSLNRALVASSPDYLAFSVLYSENINKTAPASASATAADVGAAASRPALSTGNLRTLDLVASDTNELNLWVTGLLALVEGITPLTRAEPTPLKTSISSHDRFHTMEMADGGDLSGRLFDDDNVGCDTGGAKGSRHDGKSHLGYPSPSGNNDTMSDRSNATGGTQLTGNTLGNSLLPVLNEDDDECVSSKAYRDGADVRATPSSGDCPTSAKGRSGSGADASSSSLASMSSQAEIDSEQVCISVLPEQGESGNYTKSTDAANVVPATGSNISVSVSTAKTNTKQVLGDMLVFGRHHSESPASVPAPSSSSLPASSSSALPVPLDGTAGLDVRLTSISSGVGILVCKGGEMYTWGGVPSNEAVQTRNTAAGCASRARSTAGNNNAMLGRGHCVDSIKPRVVDVRRGISETLRGMRMKSERIEQVSSGTAHCAAVSSSGVLYSWGSDDSLCGVLGFGNRGASNFIDDNADSTDGSFHTQAVLSQWTPKAVLIADPTSQTQNSADSASRRHDSPRLNQRGLSLGKQVVFVDCGKYSSAAITSDGSLYTWGSGTMGVLGHGDRRDEFEPRRVAAFTGSKKVLRVSMGAWHAAAIVFENVNASSNASGSATNGSAGPGCHVYTWGDNSQGALGVTMPAATPKGSDQVSPEGSVEVALGDEAVGPPECCAVEGTGGDSGCSGSTMKVTQSGRVEYALLPISISGAIEGTSFSSICCGTGHTVAMTRKGDIWSWGSGDGVGGQVPAIVLFPDKAGVSFVTCGDRHSAAISRRTKKLYTWGTNSHGCLGHTGVSSNSLSGPSNTSGAGGNVGASHNLQLEAVKEGAVVHRPRLVDCLADHDTLYVGCGEDTTAVVVNNINDEWPRNWKRKLERAKITSNLQSYNTFSLDDAVAMPGGNAPAASDDADVYHSVGGLATGSTNATVTSRQQRSTSAPVHHDGIAHIPGGHQQQYTHHRQSMSQPGQSGKSQASAVEERHGGGSRRLGFVQRLYRSWCRRMGKRPRGGPEDSSAMGPRKRTSSNGAAGSTASVAPAAMLDEDGMSDGGKYLLGLRLPSVRKREKDEGLMARLRVQEEENARLMREIESLKKASEARQGPSTPFMTPRAVSPKSPPQRKLSLNVCEDPATVASVSGKGRVEEVHPGVFITMARKGAGTAGAASGASFSSDSPSSTQRYEHRILKMRFSRAAFSVREAEDWWASNRERVMEDWNIAE